MKSKRQSNRLYLLHTTRKAVIKKIINRIEDVEKLEHSHTDGGNLNKADTEKVWQFTKTLNVEPV
jgi:hypothetical protein